MSLSEREQIKILTALLERALPWLDYEYNEDAERVGSLRKEIELELASIKRVGRPRVKCTLEDVHRVSSSLALNGIPASLRAVAKQLGVSKNTVARLRKGVKP
jgi:hypothetical protein